LKKARRFVLRRPFPVRLILDSKRVHRPSRNQRRRRSHRAQHFPAAYMQSAPLLSHGGTQSHFGPAAAHERQTDDDKLVKVRDAAS
jgi:hypothetical protein